MNEAESESQPAARARLLAAIVSLVVGVTLLGAKHLAYSLTGSTATTLAEMLRTYRRAAGLSKKRLAKLARIDETTLGRWERGEARRPMPATLGRLRRFFKRLGMPMPESGPEFAGPRWGRKHAGDNRDR